MVSAVEDRVAPSIPVAEWRVAQKSESIMVNPADTLPYRGIAWLFVIAGILVLFFFAPQSENRGQFFMGHFKAFAMIALAQAVLIYLLTKSSNDIFLGTGLKRLQAKVPDEDAVPVSIHIVQKGAVTGADEGFLWLDEGTLFFRGLQSVWRLNSSEMLPIEHWPNHLRPRQGLGRPETSIILASGDIQIRYRQIDPFEDFQTRRRAFRFQNNLSKWLRERPEGSLESVLPPLNVHPGLERIGPLRYEGVVSAGILVLINIALLLTTRPDFSLATVESLVSAMQFLILLALIFFSVRFAWQQRQDLIIRSRLDSATSENL